ncbi:MAG: hypothetical protein P8163_22290 [Candidatus Thiodiazotropha sp.]
MSEGADLGFQTLSYEQGSGALPLWDLLMAVLMFSLWRRANARGR